MPEIRWSVSLHMRVNGGVCGRRMQFPWRLKIHGSKKKNFSRWSWTHVRGKYVEIGGSHPWLWEWPVASPDVNGAFEAISSPVKGLEAKRPLWRLNRSGWRPAEAGGSYAGLWECI